MVGNGCSDDRFFRLALVQTAPVVGDCTHNLVSIERWTERAAAQGAEMVCFPELSVCGYSRSEVETLAEPVPGPASHYLVNLARKHGMVVSAGLIEKTGSGCYITQLVVSGDGTTQCYRKTHLGRREREVFRAGDALPVFTVITREGKAGNICHRPVLRSAFSWGGLHLRGAGGAAPAGTACRTAFRYRSVKIVAALYGSPRLRQYDVCGSLQSCTATWKRRLQRRGRGLGTIVPANCWPNGLKREKG